MIKDNSKKALLGAIVAATSPIAWSGPLELPSDYRDTGYSAKAGEVIAIDREWRRDSTAPYRGENGRLIHQFGIGEPVVVCSQAFPCDIRLEPGEIFNDAFIGKKSQWNVEAATSGKGRNNHVVHLIVSPRSNRYMGTVAMMIFTDRRTYHIKVKAGKGEGTHAIGFDYGTDTKKQFQRLRKYQQHLTRQDDPQTGYTNLAPTAADIEHGYKIVGRASWKPVTVYDDGRQTYIEFPPGVLGRKAPTLIVRSSEGTTYAVNSRRVGDKYVVDTVVDKATLIRDGNVVEITK